MPLGHGPGVEEAEMDQTLQKTCKKCDRVISLEARACSCGFPTEFATFKERAEYEVKQSRAYKQDVSATA